MNIEKNIEAIRQDFPLLKRIIRSQPVAYLDSAATKLKPQSVIDVINLYNSLGTANVHRGLYLLSEEATEAYERSRQCVADFIGAPSAEQIVFCSGATAAINLVCQSYAASQLKAGDEILLSEMEHHSNIVPWQILAERVGVVIKVAAVDELGRLDLAHWKQLIGPRTRIASFVHESNALGTINPIKEMIAYARAQGVISVVDGAQAVAHIPVNVSDLDCDFYAFSGHKMFASTGVGVLYGKQQLLEKMPPVMGGGDMIRSVDFAGTTYADAPLKFEAGTPPIAEVLSLQPAIEWIKRTGFETIHKIDVALRDYARTKLLEVPHLKIIGDHPDKAATFSFIIEDIHPHDIGTLVDQKGIAIRTGHHCTQPLMKRFGIPGTSRASLCVYNTFEEIDRLVAALIDLQKLFRG